MFGFKIGPSNILQIYRGGHPPHQTGAKLYKDDTETTQTPIHGPPERPEIIFFKNKPTA